jgi:hypothetical protein
VNTSPYPPRSLREKLVVAGIPKSEHTAELLAARMPADFSPQAFQGLSVDMMAELLLYLIAKGLVTLPVAADKALLDMLGARMSASSTPVQKIWLKCSCRISRRGWRKMKSAYGLLPI